MEAKSIITRQCASRAIKNIVWNVNDSEKKKLKKAQLPHLPTLTTQYKTYLEALDLIHTTDKDILVVGDGNLSFGRALSRLFGSPKTKQTLDRTLKKKQLSDNIDYGARNIVVTCYESAMELLSRYPHSGSVVSEIIDRGGFVLYGIDATKLQETLSSSYKTYGGDNRAFPLFKNYKYDIVICNFPHGMDESFLAKINGDLV